MSGKTATSGKRAVDYLSFDAKTSKRVSWESWEFTVVGPHQIRVTNASYGYHKDDHAYMVRVKERAGLALPAECDCPADKYHEDYACKHRVALATVGGPTVLNAALAFESSARDAPTEPETVGDKLKADGGALTLEPNPTTDECPNGDPKSDGPDGDDVPCFACYELSEDH